MTINTTSNQARFLGNGVTTIFPYTFLIPNATDLRVYFTDATGTTTLLSPSAYTVSGLGQDTGGNVTYNPLGVPIPAGSILLIQRRLPYTQSTDLVNQDGFYPQVVEDALDSLEMQLQQLVQDESLNLSVAVTDTSPGALPSAAARANKFLAFDGSGTATAASALTGTPVSAAMIPVVTAATLAAARTAMGLTAIAALGIGAGLRNDGAGNVAVNSPITNINSATSIGLAQDLFHYAVTGACTLTAVKANTLFNGFAFWVEAASADATFAIDPSDTISGSIGAGVSKTIPRGMAAFIKTDGVSTWYIDLMGEAVAKSISGAYAVTEADNFKILNHNSGAFGSITFPAVATLPANFRCFIRNGESTAIGKGVAGTNVATFTMYPGQGYLVENDNGVLTLVGGKQVYKVSSVQLFCNASTGSDNPMVSDGLAAGRAKLTQTASRNQLYQDFDHNSSQPTVTLTGGFLESVIFAGMPINCGVFFWIGSAPGAFTVQPAGAGTPYCYIIGDGAILEMQNITFSNNSINCTHIQLHQTAILDLLSGIVFGPAGGAGTHIGTDGAGWTLNVPASYTVNGVAGVHFGMVGSGMLNHAGGGTVTITGAPAIVTWFSATGPCMINLGAAITWAGAPAAGCQKWLIKTGSSMLLAGNGANVPGSVAGVPAAGAAPTASNGPVLA